MAVDQATLALGIDSSGSVAGAQVHVRAAADIQAANVTMGASFDQVAAAQQRFDLSTAAGVASRDAYFAKLDTEAAQLDGVTAAQTRYGGAMTAGAAANKALYDSAVPTADLMARQDASLQSYAASLGQTVPVWGAAAAASADMGGAIAAVEPATTIAYGGTQRLGRSLDTLALRSTGLRGPIGTVISSLGFMNIGVLGTVVAVGALSLIYDAFKSSTDNANTAAEKFGAGLLKQSDSANDLMANVSLLSAAQEKSAKSAADGAGFWATLGVGIKSLVTFQGDLTIAEAAEIAENEKQQAVGQAGLVLLLAREDAEKKHLDTMNSLASAYAQESKDNALNNQDLTAAKGLYDTASAAVAAYGASTNRVGAATAENVKNLALMNTLWPVLNKGAIQAAAAQDVFVTQQTKLKDALSLAYVAMTQGASAALALQNQQKDAAAALVVGDANWRTYTATLHDSILTHESLAVAMANGDTEAKKIYATALQNTTAIREATVTTDSYGISLQAQAAKAKEFADAEAKFADQYATDARLQLTLDGQTTDAFNAKYDEEILKIQQAADKVIAETNARQDLLLVQKLELDTLTLLTAALQVHGVEQQKQIDQATQAANAEKEINQATTDYQVALLKSLGFTTAAQDLDTAAKQRAFAAATELRVGIDGPNGLTQAEADQIIALANSTAALDDFATHSRTTHTKVSADFQDLASGIRSEFETLFTDIAKNSSTAFQLLVGDLEQMFAKMLAKMAAQALTANLGGLLGSGSASGAGVTTTNTSFGGIPGADTSAAGTAPPPPSVNPWVLAATAAVGIIGAIFSSEAADAAAAAAAAAKFQAAQIAFVSSLNDFVASITSVSGSLAAQVAASKKQTDALAATAISNFFPDSPGNDAALASAFSKGGLAAVQALEQQFLVGMDPRVKQTFTNAFAALNNSLQQVASAAGEAAQALSIQLLGTLTSEYNASQGTVGAARNTLAGFGTQQGTDLASVATGLGNGTITARTASAEDATIADTFYNNTTAFLKTLSVSDLDTLLPSLTGDTLKWATAIDAAAHATMDAADRTTLANRIATDQGKGNADLLTKQAADATEYTAAVAAGMSKANLASLQLAQGLEEATIAMNDQNKLIQNQNTSDTFSASLAQRLAALGTDPAAIKAANLQALSAAQATEYQAAVVQYQQGIITQTQLNQLGTVQLGEYNKALNTVDGSLTGVNVTVNALAVATQTLADNASQLTQQFTVFGTTLGDQANTLRVLYGFGSQSDAAIRAKYVTEQNGVELTPAQQALDNNIAAYFAVENQYLSSIATATATTATAATATAPSLSGAVTATLGSTTPIIGPGGTFNIKIEVVVDPETAKNGTAISKQIADSLDVYFSQRASLVRTAQGLT